MKKPTVRFRQIPSEPSKVTVGLPSFRQPYYNRVTVDGNLAGSEEEPESRTFTLELIPLSGRWHTPPEQRLRLALKTLLRAFGLRAVVVRPAKSMAQPGASCEMPSDIPAPREH